MCTQENSEKQSTPQDSNGYTSLGFHIEPS